MFHRKSSSLAFSSLFVCLGAIGLLFLSGCGVGPLATGNDSATGGSYAMGGILHGGPNPIIDATITLYTTTSSGYVAAATAVATATTDGNGFFNLTLPTNVVVCPAGEYAYVTAYAGNTGGGTTNANSLLMVPIGPCSANYTTTGSGPYINTYVGPNLWIDELTTAVSAYTLGNFMTVTNAGVVNISAPANNHGTASSSTPSAAGLAHAFANALAIMNISNGQPKAYTYGGTSKATGGVIPDAEIFLLGNILQACVNSDGVTGTNTATANDGSGCGMLFSFTTPPQSGAPVPENTLQAMLDLAKYPNPQISTWNNNCTSAGSGTNTSTTCLFNLAPSIGAYGGALTSAPPDWSLAVVYTSGYGVNTTATACLSATCPGLTYPFYIAMDYSDNVYVLNYNASAATYPNSASSWTNIVGIGYDGAPIFSSPEDTTDKSISIIGTDTAGHIFGANNGSTTVQVYSTSSGSVLASPTYTNTSPLAVAADPFNNIYVASYDGGVNLRKFSYGGTSTSPTYTVSTVTSTGPASPVYQIGFDPNLDLYELENGSTPAVYMLANENSGITSAGTYPSAGALATITGSTGNAAGIGANSANGAYVIDSVGITPITKSGSGATATISAGSPIAIPTVTNSTLYNRFLSVDGNNWAYSVDGGNGGLSGVSVYDSIDTLALGTYKGCYVINNVCGTVAGSAPMVSPRAAAIDSAGDIWVVSGAGADLTELIGAAAPTWPGLSMAKFGRPQ